MGLFSNNKKPCPICGAPTPRLLATKVEGVPICKQCDAKVHLPHGTLDRMNLAAFRQYLNFYDDNAALRDKFHMDYSFDVAGWSAQVDIDLSNRLFRLSNSDNDIVFEAGCLRSFQILEDAQPLLEGDKSALRCYDSDVPEKARNIQPIIDQYLQDMRHYEYMKRLEDMRDKDDDDKQRSRPYLREPRFDPPLPVSKFHVILTLDHPYWPTFEGELDAPNFGWGDPSVSYYLQQYQEKANSLAVFAKNLMRLIAPGAPTVRNGGNVGYQPAAPAAPAVSGDVVAELQKYKSLVDAGILTPEEFAAKKRQLLGI